MNKKTIIVFLASALVGFYLITRKTAVSQRVTRSATGAIRQVKRGISMIATNISERGRQLIKSAEGLDLNVYNDAGGYSIGYGRYLGKIKTLLKITQAQAEEFFIQDVANVEKEMQRYIKVSLNQNQHDALVSFFYNLGHKGFVNANGSKTQLLQKLNRGEYLAAANELDRWVYAEGKKNSRLTTRRANEKALFLA